MLLAKDSIAASRNHRLLIGPRRKTAPAINVCVNTSDYLILWLEQAVDKAMLATEWFKR